MTQAPTTNPRYSQDASPEERSRILKEQARVIAEQEERTAGTRAAYNNIVDPLPSGRWSKPSRGNDPAKLYPALPDGPWSSSQPQPPPEEPLGYSIDEMQTCGEVFEVERSLSPPATSPVAADRSSIGGQPPDPLSKLGQGSVSGVESGSSFTRRKFT
jgi:hypothetical protein